MEVSISPQPCAVGEDSKINSEMQSGNRSKNSYASMVNGQQAVENNSQLDLCPISFDQDLPTVEFTMDEVNSFTKEEGLQQAVIIKFSYGKPNLQDLRQILPNQFGVKGSCNIGQLEYRHILVRFDLFDDFTQVVSRTNGYIRSKGSDFFFRSFPWTMEFNPREETPKVVVWISLPDLPANLFARKSLLSIASAVGKPIAIDQATKDRTRPSTARVKVLINLLDNHPTKIKIKIVDPKTGKAVDFYQKIVIDNAHAYCMFCNHQGHNAKSCRRIVEKGSVITDNVSSNNMPKLKGDARDYLNAKHVVRQSVVHVADQLKTSTTDIQGGQGISCSNIQRWQVKVGENIAPNSSSAVADSLEKLAAINDKIACVTAQKIPVTLTDQAGRDDQLVNKKDQDVQCNSKLVEGPTDKSTEFSVADSAEKEGQVVKGNRDFVEGKTVECTCEPKSPFSDKENTLPNKDKVVTIVTAEKFVNEDVSCQLNPDAESCKPFLTVASTLNKHNEDLNFTVASKLNKHSEDLNLTVASNLCKQGCKNDQQILVSTDIEKVKGNDRNNIVWNGYLNPSNIEESALLNDHANINTVLSKSDDNYATTSIKMARVIDLSDVRMLVNVGASSGQMVPTAENNIEDSDKGIATAKGIASAGVGSGHIPSSETTSSLIDDSAQANKKIDTVASILTPLSEQPSKRNDEARGNLDQITRTEATSDNAVDKEKEILRADQQFELQQRNPVEDVIQSVCNISSNKAVNTVLNSNVTVEGHSEIAGSKEIVRQNVSNEHLSPDQQHFSQKVVIITPVSTQQNSIDQPKELDGLNGKEKHSAFAYKAHSNQLFETEEQHKTVAAVNSKSQCVKGGQTNSAPAQFKNANSQLQPKFQISTITSNHTWPKWKNTVSKSKLWIDQRDYDDEESWCEGFAAYSTEEEDQEYSGEESDDSVKPKVQRKITNNNSCASLKQTPTQNSLLNHNAPGFVPRNNAKHVTTTVATANFNKNKCQLSLAETSVGNEIANALPSTSKNQKQQRNAKSQSGQIVTAASVILERQLLEAMEMPNPLLPGRHLYEEGEEKDILNQCRADTSIKGDLSPMHSARKKKSHQRERSWDGRACEDVIIRKLPMRNAKQKQTVQPSVLKATRLRNKREG